MIHFLNALSTEQRKITSEKNALHDKFNTLMFELDLFNKFDDTYYLQILKNTEYGYFARLYLAPGLSFADLEKHIGTVQENLRCIWIMQTEQLQEFATVKIVTKPVDLSITYENPGIRPWELYLGLDLSKHINKTDVNDHHMFLLTAAIGAGKTRYIYMLLLSWILSCNVNEVEIFLSDCAKNEFCNFQYCKHVRSYASELKDLHKIMQYLEIRIEKRKQVISKAREEGWATNIKEYNKASKSKLSYIYLVIDEYSVITPDKSDNKQEVEMKQYIIDVLKRISKIGRSIGVFCFVALQKATKEEMSASIIKNMSAVRISFRANDSVSSEVIIGDSSAVGLADRYAVYSLNGGDKKDYLFAPCLTTERLNELLKPYIDRSFKKINLDSEIEAVKHPPETKNTKIYKLDEKRIKKQHHDLIDTRREGEIIDC